MKPVTFPILYKKTSTGAIQYWRISVLGCVIQTAYGQVNGKEQITEDVISQGKNLGKANETTPEQQAEAEAKAQWEKKKKKSYVEELDRAENSETDIDGGADCMLAQAYSKHAAKIIWPAYCQPKYDGIRMVAILDHGVCTLWTRTRKPILSLPHIVADLERQFPKGYYVLDGEAYNHEYKKDFEHIVHLVRQEEPTEGHELVQYYIYDTISVETFEERNTWLLKNVEQNDYIKLVDTILATNEDEAMAVFQQFVAEGYEGLMLRNAAGKYVGKRSYDLQKVKEFEDAEFPIVGIEEGRGKLMGHAGAFLVTASNGEQFAAKMMGNVERLKDYFNQHALWKGKQLTVKFQGLTKYGIPRFPVGVAIRDYE